MKSSSPKSAPVLKQVANLWTLSQYPSAAREWTVEAKFKAVRQAGFDGIAGGADPKMVALCEAHGFDYVCYIDVTAGNIKEKLELAQATRPARVNVQLGNHDTPPREAAKIWIKTAAMAEKMGLAVDLEVHRDTATETPEKTYEIAALFQKATGRKIRFSWDFSHLAVVKHLNPPYAERLLVRPDLVQFARQFHFRPFNGHHAQIPATNGKGQETPEIHDYLAFIEALIDCWFAGAKGGEVIYICPELGPVAGGYGLTSFADVWKDAQFIRAKTEALWKAKVKKF